MRNRSIGGSRVRHLLLGAIAALVVGAGYWFGLDWAFEYLAMR